MKKLIILNYQREVPPFMINEISIAKKYFDIIYYVTPYLVNDNSNAIKCENVFVIQMGKCKKIKAIIPAVCKLFSKEILDDFIGAIKSKVNLKSFTRHIAAEAGCASMLYNESSKIIRESDNNDQVVVLAAWFSVEAYAAALLKRKFNQIRAFSFAHAFELNSEVNDFVALSLNEFKQLWIDKVFFISNTMRNVYHNATKNKFAKYNTKEFVRYLGSKKIYSTNNETQNEEFNICSCSTMVELKRLNLICESLKFWHNDCTIVWTHIGDGPMFEELKKQSENVLKINSKIKINLLGKLSNKEVQNYYANNSVDLFVSVSSSEGLPISILEALSYGIPVLATNVGSCGEVVTNDVGFLIDKFIDPEGLCEYFLKFQGFSKDEKQLYRDNAFKRWMEKFNIENTARNFYNEL